MDVGAPTEAGELLRRALAEPPPPPREWVSVLRELAARGCKRRPPDSP